MCDFVDSPWKALKEIGLLELLPASRTLGNELYRTIFKGGDTHYILLQVLILAYVQTTKV